MGLAEELAQDALVVALERWPQSGIPHNPAAWLMATAKHRAIDLIRRSARFQRKHEELGRLDEASAEFERAASQTRNGRERELLLERASACAHPPTPSRPH